MNPLTERDILSHQELVPWGQLRQVEQDLQLCRVMSAVFADKFLRSHAAMRGGTLLHKVHLAPPVRYSEDIDLVMIGDRPENHIQKALVRVLNPVLGKPSQSLWDWVTLTIRNAGMASRILRLVYSVPCLADPGKNLTIKIEANVNERKPYHDVVGLPFAFPFQGGMVETTVNGYELNEMLGTKLRALFQRRAGRDLFDLYWALTQNANVVPAEIIAAFNFYLHQEGTTPRRQDFLDVLHSHLGNAGFCSDMTQLLRKGIAYDPVEAGRYIEANLLSLVPT